MKRKRYDVRLLGADGAVIAEDVRYGGKSATDAGVALVRAYARTQGQHYEREWDAPYDWYGCRTGEHVRVEIEQEA